MKQYHAPAMKSRTEGRQAFNSEEHDDFNKAQSLMKVFICVVFLMILSIVLFSVSGQAFDQMMYEQYDAPVEQHKQHLEESR